MINIELYINNRLADVGESFSIRLNRQLINPGELNTKDAQYSYSISLPPTRRNHEIFNFANVEEVAGKFNRNYTAELIINSIRIFIGNFRLTAVSQTSYKGNLYVPAATTVKELFGETKLNEHPEYRIPFYGFADYVSWYNNNAANGPQMAVFPFVLYGLLPKAPLNYDGSGYTAKNIWDSSVRLGMQDIPPSINPLLLLKHIFESQGYNLTGSAFSDSRLTNLYMSYKNDPAFVQPWNFGYQGEIHVSGEWSNVTNMRTNTEQFERGVYVSTAEKDTVYACNLFDSNNADINVEYDPGANVIKTEAQDGTGRTWVRTQVRIPASGYYKVQFKANMLLDDSFRFDTENGISYVGAYGTVGGLHYTKAAVKLVRDRKNADFGNSFNKFDGVFNRDNLPQSEDRDSNNIPRLAPAYYGVGKGSTVFVDLAQNENHLAGFQWGKKRDEDVSELDADGTWSLITAAKTALSWDASRTGSYRNHLAIANPFGYFRYDIPAEAEDTDPPIWTGTNRFACNLNNAPDNRSRRGYFNNTPQDPLLSAEGHVNCVVWLEAGELLTVVDAHDEGIQRVGSNRYTGWFAKTVSFDLIITPFRVEQDWVKIDDYGYQLIGTSHNWDDPVNFDIDSIDLIKFLPADMKTDDFIDNLCKAFNLQLTAVNDNTFALNVKPRRETSNLYLDLDRVASVRDRENTSLGLPAEYKIGFTVDKEEEGYVRTGDDGGGEFKTGSIEEKNDRAKKVLSRITGLRK